MDVAMLSTSSLYIGYGLEMIFYYLKVNIERPEKEDHTESMVPQFAVLVRMRLCDFGTYFIRMSLVDRNVVVVVGN